MVAVPSSNQNWMLDVRMLEHDARDSLISVGHSDNGGQDHCMLGARLVVYQLKVLRSSLTRTC
eukprot:13892106-Ditylum_brightwellii.AAC.1